VQGFFIGYQARSALPSNFDCALGQSLGYTAAHLVAAGHTGYLATVSNLSAPVATWKPSGVPLTALVTVPVPTAGCFGPAAEGSPHRGLRPIVPSTPLDVHGQAFQKLSAARAAWAKGEEYQNPGPIQLTTGSAATNQTTITLQTDTHDYLAKLERFSATLEHLKGAIKPGVPERVLDAAVSGVVSLAHILGSLADV
jgi:6-phosphofructokinase 1